MKKINDALLYKLIGERIRDSRHYEDKKIKITQSDLAERTGVTRTSITNIEQGNQKLPVHLLYEICAQLDLGIEDILPSLEGLMSSSLLSDSLDKQFGEEKERVENIVKSFVNERMNKA